MTTDQVLGLAGVLAVLMLVQTVLLMRYVADRFADVGREFVDVGRRLSEIEAAMPRRLIQTAEGAYECLPKKPNRRRKIW